MIKNYKTLSRALLLAAAGFLSQSDMRSQVTVQTFSYTGSIQTFTVPPCVTTITMDVRGAQGGFSSNGSGGLGARMVGVVAVTPGQILRYLVGQSPGNVASLGFTWPAGGGGSYVATGPSVATASPLVVAGGGGGGYGTNGNNAPTTTSGTGITPGINGNGAPANSCGGGGGGFFTSGGNDIIYGFFGGAGFQQGGAGGTASALYATSGYQPGGFGGGTAANYVGSCNLQGGNGGGYSGGSSYNTSVIGAGTAGGSFNTGTNQSNTAGFQTGNGLITFSYTSGSAVQVVATPTAICSGGSATLSASNVSSYTWSPGNAVGPNLIVSPTTSSTYTVVGTNTAGCTTSVAITVTVTSGLPVMTVNSTTNNVCLGKAITLTANGALTYTWSNGIINGQPFQPAVTSNYTVQGQNGCGITTVVSGVTVAPIAIAVSATPTLVCQGYTSTLTAIASATSYTWLPANTSSSFAIVAPTANSIYTVAVSDGTCSGTATVGVTTKITPTISIVASATNICEGDEVILTASGAGAGGTYSWIPSGSTNFSISAAPSIPSSYSVAGTNSLNCTAGLQQVIIVQAAPAINVTASRTLACAGSAVTLTASNANTYTWTNGPSTAGFTVNAASTTVYTVTGGHLVNICTKTATIAVVAIIPNVTVTPSSAICVGNSANLSAGGASSYTWTGFAPSTNGNVVVTPASTTLYSLSANTQSLNAANQPVNCVTTHTSQVTVNALPTLTATTIRTTICKGETNTLTVSGAATYSWGAAGSGTAVVVKPLTTTFYTVTGTDANGCVSELLVQAKVNNCAGINSFVGDKNAISVYPNPNNGDFTVTTSTAMSLSLINSLGQIISVIELNDANGNVVKIKDISNGVYFLVGENANGRVNQRIVVAK